MDQIDGFRNGSHNQIHRIGIIYAPSSALAKGHEIEQVAECETAVIAREIQALLQLQGNLADLIELDPLNLDELLQYNWIFNLAETVSGFPLRDYQVAEELERRHLHFTGAGSTSLKACRDKAFTKTALSHNGMVTPNYEVYAPCTPICTNLIFPLMVKPLYEDGSFGITEDSKVYTKEKLAQGIRRIHHEYHQPALVEEFIDGKDVTVSILGNSDKAVVLPLSEIIYPANYGTNFITYNAKWIPDSQEYRSSETHCPANLDPALAKAIGEYALRACRIMGCWDYTRVDFRLKGDTSYFLEVNPNPCINPNDSGFVRAARAAGYSYSDLINAILLHSWTRSDTRF